MSFQFSKHYTIEEARSLLPSIRTWLEEISVLRERLSKLDVRLASLGSSGSDVGGDTVNSSIKLRADLLSVVQEFAARGIRSVPADTASARRLAASRGNENCAKPAVSGSR